MKRYVYVLSLFGLCVMPLTVSAHQHATFTINGSTYQFVVGSLNEPLIVDDKSGVDLTVTKGAGTPTMGPDGDMDGPPSGGTPVAGLDQTLKVTLGGGGKKETLSLTPQYGKAGAYQAVFYPTVATTLSYEFTGTIDKTPVDITFTCTPEGGAAADDTTTHQLSGTVTQTMLTGAFGCPLDKASLGFPEQSSSILSINQIASKADNTAVWAIALAILGIVIALAAHMRRRS